MQPLYTPANCKPAYELRWSLALFSTSPLPGREQWLERLMQVLESDGVRILEHRSPESAVNQFLLSTKPVVSPTAIVKSVKGRLQHLLQSIVPNAFRRNFSLTSVGNARRDIIEKYIRSQLGHHKMADTRMDDRLSKFQLEFPDVHLAEPQFSSHGRYIYNLHVVLVHDGRWSDADEERLTQSREMCVKAARKKRHRLSRLAILSDHLHATLGCQYDESPEAVALSYLNNLAFAHGMKPLYQFSYFVGTFGEYDVGAIRRKL